MKQFFTLLLTIVVYSISVAQTNITPNGGSTIVGTIPGTGSTNGQGAATYSFPINVLPGVNGAQPSINLNYNSQSRDGIAGYGWNLTAYSVISRAGKDNYHNGTSSPVNYTNSNDAFILDGQRLFPVSGNNGADGTIYGMESENFSKIVSYGGSETAGPAWFQVTTKDGKVMEYGHANSSTFLTDDGASTVVWFLNKITDQNGNYIVYNYSIDNTGRSYALSEIDYTGNTTTGIAPFAKVNFSYSLRSNQANTVYDGGSSLKRPFNLSTITVTDVASGVIANTYQFTYTQVKNDYYLQSVTQSDKNGNTLNPLSFTYGANTSASDVSISGQYTGFASNNTYAGNFSGSSAQEVLTADYTLDNNNVPHYTGYRVISNYGAYANQPAATPLYSYSIPQASSTATEVLGALNGSYSFLTYDYDGDGKQDVLMVNSTMSGSNRLFNGVTINYSRYYNDAQGATYQTINYPQVPSSQGTTYNYIINASNYFIPGDFNGDGYQDYILVLSPGGTSTKAFFSSPALGIFNQEVINFPPIANATIPIDFDGDGKTDILSTNSSSSNIISISPTSSAPGSGYTASVIYSTSALSSQCQIFPGDFNGDRKTDFLIRTGTPSNGNTIHNINGTWSILTSTGKALISSPFVFTNRPSLAGDIYKDSRGNVTYYDDNNVLMVADLNGDGKTDIWHSLDTVNNNTSLSKHILYYSTGQSFISDAYYIPDPETAVNSLSHTIGDFNGDGKPDILSLVGGTSDIGHFIYPKPFKEDHFLVQAINGAGASTKFNYSLTNAGNIYSRTASYAYDPQPTNNQLTLGPNGAPYNVINQPLYVLQSLSVPDGIGGNASTSFVYADAVFHRLKGFLGFKQVSATGINGITSTTVNDINTQFFVPHLIKQYTAYGASTISEKRITDTFLAANSSNSSDKRFIHQTLSTQDINYLTGAAVQTDNTYDNYGNITTNVGKSGSWNGSSVDAVETATTTIVLGVHNTPVPALPDNATVQKQRNGQPMITKTAGITYDANGNVATKTEFSGTPKAVTTSYTYDNYGNVTQSVVSASGVNNRTSKNIMDAQGRFILQKQQIGSGVTLTESTTYDTWGHPLTQTSSDGLTTSYQYDGFGRLVQSTLPDGENITQTLNWVTGGNASYTSTQHAVNGGHPDVKITYDILGREISRQSTGFNGAQLMQTTTYDNKGNITSKTDPYYANETPVTTTSTYDTYNRPQQITKGSSVASYTYSAVSGGLFTVTITNAAGQATSKTSDGAGRIVTATDNGGQLNYTYDSWGNQLTASMAGKTFVTSVYDSYGKQTSLADLNAGTITYGYDALGQLTSQTDANNNTYTINYDDFGRVTSRTGPEGTTSTTYYYNAGTGYGNSNPVTITGFAGDVTQFTYDNLNRKQTQTITTDGTAYTTQYAYDAYNHLVKTTYASGIVINDSYDGNGIHIKTNLQDGSTNKDIFIATAMNSKGIYTGYTLGNGQASQVNYDLTAGTPTRYYTPGIQDLNMNWDTQKGNLNSRNDAIKSLTESFTYDNLNRLTGATVNNVQQFAMTYDNSNGASLGNIATKTDAGNYVYQTDKINAVAYITNPAGANVPPPVLSTQTQQLTYTPFLKTSTIDQNGYHLAYTYAADQQRIKSVLQQNGTTIETHYYLGAEERQIIPGVTDRYIHYISAGNGLAAVAVKENGVTNIYYAYTDHLGSILTLTDGNGNIIAKQNFDAWGRYRNPDDWTYNNVPTNNPSWLYRGYTGHEHLSIFGLVNMNGRMYDPVQGRMLSPDNYTQAPWNTQNYNKYTYCLNNPLRYTDPTGNFSTQAEFFGAIESLWNSPFGFGGYVSGIGGPPTYFTSMDAAFGYGVAQITNWGANGAYGGAGSFSQALKNYNSGGMITPGMVQGYYQYAWAGLGRFDIGANYAWGSNMGRGFDVTYAYNVGITPIGSYLEAVGVGSMFVSYSTMRGLLEGAATYLSGEENNVLGKVGAVIGAGGLSLDLTTHSTQYLANALRGSSRILNIEKAGVQIGNLGKVTVGMTSKVLTGAGVVIPLVDMAFNPNADYWGDGTDAVMGGVAFIPGVGWVISGVYFIGNAALQGATGHNSGYYIEQGYDEFSKAVEESSIFQNPSALRIGY